MAVYGLDITQQPAKEPVTVDELKKHIGLALSDSYHDQQLAVLITSARELFENETDRVLVNTTFSYTIDCFPTDEIYLPKAPVQSVTSIKYTTTAGSADTTVATTVYQTMLTRTPPMISLKVSQQWPGVYNQAASVAIVFVAGYGASASSVPDLIKQGIKLICGEWFDPQGNPDTSAVPAAAQRIMQMYETGTAYHDFSHKAW